MDIHTISVRGDDLIYRIAIFYDLTEKKQTDKRLWHQANYDNLTGLPNRRLFLDRLDDELRKAAYHKQKVALLFLDLDNFKDVNDTLGHEVGDLLLIEAARRLRANINDGSIARLGGDEFAILISGADAINEAERVAAVISRELNHCFLLGENKIYLSVSIGITLHPDDGADAKSLFKNADQAMYAAKKSGRNQHSWFQTNMQVSVRRRREIADRLRQSIGTSDFQVHYQPVVELSNLRIVKAEALIRWVPRDCEAIGPSVFIPVAEEIGLINEIDDWTFSKVIDLAKRINNPGLSIVQLAVNKSARQLNSDGDVNAWEVEVRQQGLSSDNITIEITEGVLLDHRSEIVEKLTWLHESGFQIALDDFGTGYSAMSYLLRFPLDFLKIDQSFVRNINIPNGRAIVEAVVAMAHKLGLRVIAEGVEEVPQLEFLRSIGCDFAQGFLFAQPMPEHDFEDLLNRSRRGELIFEF